MQALPRNGRHMPIPSKPQQRKKMIGYLIEAIRGAASCLSAAEEAICKKVDLSIEQWNALTRIGRPLAESAFRLTTGPWIEALTPVDLRTGAGS